MRCEICDYTNEFGSDLTQKPPDRKNGIRVRKNGQMCCDDCFNTYLNLLEDYRQTDYEKDLEEIVRTGTPTLPVR